MNYDNIESYKKPGPYPLSRRCIFRKLTSEVKLILPPGLLRVKARKYHYF